MNERLIPPTLICLGLLAGSYWLITPPAPDISVSRFKLVFEIDTPDGVKSGTTAFELSTRTQTFSPLQLIVWGGRPEYSRPITDLAGEAAVIDNIPRSGTPLFATMLLRDYQRTYQHIALECFGQQMELVHSSPLGSSAEVRRDLFPVLVAFRDLSDPRTAVEVSTASFELSFGRGYSVRKVTIEKVDQPLKQTIARQFPELIAKLQEAIGRRIALRGAAYGPHVSDFMIARK